MRWKITMNGKYMDIIAPNQIKQICKWCRRTIEATGLEHSLCRLIYVTNHDWAHTDAYKPRKKIEVRDENNHIVGNYCAHKSMRGFECIDCGAYYD